MQNMLRLTRGLYRTVFDRFCYQSDNAQYGSCVSNVTRTISIALSSVSVHETDNNYITKIGFQKIAKFRMQKWMFLMRFSIAKIADAFLLVKNAVFAALHINIIH